MFSCICASVKWARKIFFSFPSKRTVLLVKNIHKNYKQSTQKKKIKQITLHYTQNEATVANGWHWYLLKNTAYDVTRLTNMAVGQVFTYLCTAVFNIENSNNRKKKKRLDKNYRKKNYMKKEIGIRWNK